MKSVASDASALLPDFGWANVGSVSISTCICAFPLARAQITAVEEVEDPGRILDGQGVAVEGVKE